MAKRIIVLLSLLGVLCAAPIVTGDEPQAKAAAINLSTTHEHSVRLTVNRYAEIQVSQREPYCWGGTGPNCFDCSGLVIGSYNYAGIHIPVRSSNSMYFWTTRTSLKYARTGDLLFYDYDHDGVVTHVEMFYRKNGSGPAMAVSATYTGGPPVNFHSIRYTGLVKVGQAVT